MKKMFDVERFAKELGLSKKELYEIWKQVREEFPNDQLMQELHIIRAITSRQKVALA